MELLQRENKMHALILSVFFFSQVSRGLATACMRVVGGSETSIERYPTATAILRLDADVPIQICGGTVVSQRHILTVAHCFALNIVIDSWRYIIRVGSTQANSGGATHYISKIILHPKWNPLTIDNDVAIMETVTYMVYSKTVQPAKLPGTTYMLRENTPVWAIGWGLTSENGEPSENLRHVQVLIVNETVCKTIFQKYIEITANMMCTGWLAVGGRDQCTRDSGSPVFHNSFVVGLSSMGVGCGRPFYPGINTKVSQYTYWIQSVIKLLRNPLLSQLSPIELAFKFNVGYK